MKKHMVPSIPRLALAFGLALLLIGAALAFAPGRASATAPQQTEGADPFHPPFELLDQDGVNVLDSGAPVSTMQTCGACHDTGFIVSHSFHADAGLSDFGEPGSADGGYPWDTSPGEFGSWNPIEYRYLSPNADPITDLTTAEWLMLFGAGHVGGGPAAIARTGLPLTELQPGSTVESQIHDPETGELVAWDWSESGVVEMNCFLCHTTEPNLQAREGELQKGAFGWANTATLAGTGIVEAQGDTYAYNPDAFDSEGNLTPDFILVQDPTNQNCGACHGLVHTNPDIPLTNEGISEWRTSTTGQIISPQRISDSGLNLEGKEALKRTWDTHSEHVVGCTDCHFSLNNPIYTDIAPDEDLAHLIFDPRRVDISAYLERPVHDFARGPNSQDSISPELAGTMRRCESCHESEQTHSWLPYTDRHLSALSCETCHIPQLYAPAYEQVDWTVLTADGEPRITYRGVENPDSDHPFLTGFQPTLLPATDVDGQTKLAPFNMVSSWYWVYGEADDAVRPVPESALRAAWFEDGRYRPDVLAAFDASGDGRLDASELVIDSDEKESVIADGLAALGLENPVITGEVRPYGIHHDVADGEWATKECRVCHGEESKITQPVLLAGAVPGGKLPELQTRSGSPTGAMEIDENGALIFAPVTADQDLYILGHDSVGWIDGFGILAFLGVLVGVTTHGGLRYFAARKKAGEAAEPEIREVYMYGVYERLWHWLQTAAILLLLFTGLIIHKPDMFGIFSFRYVVIVHNVLAGVLVVNAALSLFYHLVSGEIQQYLPRPRGFFDDAIVQIKFYVQGIFRGDPHPFEKTRNKKLNPLQQVTYFGILNILLPLQVITGGLMWGAQRWPEIANRLGGLPFLGPFHSLVAWMFAAFIVAHVYLTTTGPYPMAGIKAMMLGWDEVEVHPDHAPAPEAAAAD